MATLDIIILVVILLSAAIGLVRGLMKELLSLAAWVLSFVIALVFANEVGEMLPVAWGSETIRMTIAFVLIFVAVLIASGIVQWLVAQLIRSTGLTGTDRFLGFLFGSIRGVLVAIVVLMGVREIAGDAPWYQEAKLPVELLAFEDEVRELLGQVRDAVPTPDVDINLD